jgi:PAS domain S-box-containing protein
MDMWPGIESTAVFAKIKRSMEERTSECMENYFTFPDGTNGWFDLRIDPVPEGVFILSIDITERKKAEEALKESEERFRSVLENSLDVIYRCNLQTGVYEYTSPAIRTMGYEPEEIVKMSNAQVFSLVHPDDLPEFRESLSKINQTGKGTVEYRFKGKDGTYKWWSVQFIVTKDKNGKPLYRDGFARDITQRKKAEEASKTTLDRFYKTLSKMQGAILLVSSQGLVEFANQSFCKTFNLKQPPEELIGLTAPNVIDKIKNSYLHPEQEVQRISEIVAAGNLVTGEEVCMTAGRTFLRDFIPLHIEGKSFSRLWHHMDITPQKKAEEALRESRQRWSTTLSSIGDAVIATDTEGKITFLNHFNNLIKYLSYIQYKGSKNSIWS